MYIQICNMLNFYLKSRSTIFSFHLLNGLYAIDKIVIKMYDVDFSILSLTMVNVYHLFTIYECNNDLTHEQKKKKERLNNEYQCLQICSSFNFILLRYRIPKKSFNNITCALNKSVLCE